MEYVTSETRSKIMSAIHSKNTKPEIMVRQYLWHHGFRYSLNQKRLPGHPDIVLRKYKTCVFVNGCFWHGHDCPEYREPKSNVEFWTNKIARNKERDAKEHEELERLGWKVIVVWECELKKKRREETLERLVETLRINIGGNATYEQNDSAPAMAAESEQEYEG